jgi:hypothetical protein
MKPVEKCGPGKFKIDKKYIILFRAQAKPFFTIADRERKIQKGE